jgi:hypothetical protein
VSRDQKLDMDEAQALHSLRGPSVFSPAFVDHQDQDENNWTLLRVVLLWQSRFM